MRGVLRAVPIVSAMLCLTGCIATFSGVVRNESDSALMAINVKNPAYSEVIEPRTSKRIKWSHYCQAFEIEGRKRYFDTYKYVPEAEMFSIGPETKLRILYKDSHLYFDGRRKGLTPISEIDADSCVRRSELRVDIHTYTLDRHRLRSEPPRKPPTAGITDHIYM